MGSLEAISLKDLGMTVGIIGSIVGASVGYGTHTQALKETKQQVGEVKTELKEHRDVNLKQTIAIKEQAVVLERVVKVMERLEKRLDENSF